MENGKYVSRSVYQKLKEENKRLLEDIKILSMPATTQYSLMKKNKVKDKWQNKFEHDTEIAYVLKQSAQEYLNEHPEYDITRPGFSLEKINHLENIQNIIDKKLGGE